jgi:hypothetical protein
VSFVILKTCGPVEGLGRGGKDDMWSFDMNTNRRGTIEAT